MKNKILAAVIALLAVSSAVGYQYFKGEKTNYLDAVTETYQAVAEIQSDLSIAAGNLSATDAGTVETFVGKLNSAKDILLEKNKNFSKVDVPEESADDNKKLLESLKTEYNLMNRWKEAVSINNEYEAADDFAKSKDLMLELKEKSAMLSIDGNYFEEIFNLATAYEKVEKYLNAKKQSRYDKDQKEQAERDKAAAAEKARQEAAVAAAERKKNSAEREIGVYPATGLRAYLLTDTITRFSDGFSCTVVCYPSGNPYYISYTFTQRYNGVYFTNSDGYGEYINSFETPVEYNVWKYVW